MTRADYIRSLSDKGLAKFLDWYANVITDNECVCPFPAERCPECKGSECADCIKKYLQEDIGERPKKTKKVLST